MAVLHDVAVIGGGIVGMASAMALSRHRSLSLIVLEAEGDLAEHQTGHNSGVIHSGLYYKPGSLKARNCAEGRRAMYRFCQENGIPHERCGKVVVATDASEFAALDELERRGLANGLTGLRRLDGAGLRGLFVQETGIVDYRAVTHAYADRVRASGGQVRLDARVTACRRDGPELVLETTAGEVRSRGLVNCAGLQSDRVARLCGVEPGIQVVPFRGEYYELVPEKTHLVRNLIYPVPDPRFPFLGVHFTRMVRGGVECGPNAVLAFRREGYRFSEVSLRDLGEMLRFPGFWKMACKYWRTGASEMARSLSKRLFWLSLRRLIPELRMDDIRPAGAGVRAQALDRDGKLVDDFCIVTAERMVHVLNAPSPAATASLSVGQHIADLAERTFGLQPGRGGGLCA